MDKILDPDALFVLACSMIDKFLMT
jgi:hypothetical protein